MATAPSTTPYFTAPYSFPARNPHPSPFPFFSPPPPPAPTPTPFTAPSAFGAPASGSPLIPPPPAYPYAGTAANGVSPAPAYPYATPFPYPPPPPVFFQAPAYDPNQPTPAPPQIHGDPSYSTAETNGNAFLPNAAPTVPNRERHPPQGHVSSTPVLYTATPAAMCKSSYLTEGNGAGGESISNEKLVRKHTGSRILSMANNDSNNSFVTHQGQFQSSFDSLHGELSKLSALVSQFAVKMGLQTTKVLVPGSPLLESTPSAPLFGSIASAARTKSARLSPVGSVHPSTGTVSVAAHVFGEMPTPSSCQGTHGSAPDYISGHHIPIQSACVSNFSEQNFGEKAQEYDFHNLSHKSVFRADGTEHSYYALPENSPLERATREPVFDVYAGEKDGSSTDFVDVLASLQEQHTHEDQQTYGSIEYNHSNNEIELPSVTNSELCTELGKAQVHNHEWNMLLTEKREEWDPGIRKTLMDISQVAKLSSFTLVSSPLSMLWDPGASLPLISIKARQLDQTLQTSIHASTLVDKLHGQENVASLAGSSVTGFNRYTCLSFWVQYKFYVLWKSEIGMTTCISWDPGIRHYMAPNGIISVHQDNSFIMLRAAHFSECKYPCSLYCKCMLKTEYCPSRCLSEISVSCLKRLQWNPGDFTHMLLVLCVSCREIPDNCFADLKLMANTSSKLAALTWHSSLSGTPFLLLSSTTYTWEPGVQCIIDRLLDKFIESNQVQSVQQIRYHAASVWDSSTILLGYKSKWWLLFTEEKTNWHKDINRYGIALWLITFNPP